MVALIQPSFAKGEVSPSVYGRVDLKMYYVALRTARNFIVAPTGGASNRRGLEYQEPVKDHTYPPRLIDFEFNTTDRHVLEVGDFYMRFLRNSRHITEATKTITGATAANPVVITAAAHGYANGDEVYIASVAGMWELNGRRFIVANKATNTFELTSQVTGADIDGSAYTAYTSGGTAARIYEIATPWAIADVWDLKWVQSADVMTFTHRGYPTQELARSALASWALTEPTFEPAIAAPVGQTVTVNSAGAVTRRYRVTAIAQDTFEESLPGLNNTSRTITGVSAADPAVVTAVGHSFSTGDEVFITGIVGMTELNDRRFTITSLTADTFELDDEDSSAYTAYSSAGTARQTFVRITTSAAAPNNTIAWTAVADAQRYVIYREDDGLFGFIGESEKTSFTDNNIEPDMTVSPPQFRNPFAGADNYPGTVSYYEQRRAFGGSVNSPDTTYYSVIGSPYNFSVSTPTQPDDAITHTLASLKVNEIRHLVPGNDLIVLTSGAEWRVNSGGDAAFEAATLRQKPQSYWGSSHMRAQVAGDYVLFTTLKQNKVRAMGYDFASDKYKANDPLLLADHLLDGKTLTEWAWHTQTETLYAIRDDGVCLVFTFKPDEDVLAWATMDTDGDFEAVCTSGHDAACPHEYIYFVVKRTINGSTVRYIESTYRNALDEVQDGVHLDCAMVLDAPITITGATAANPVVITAVAHGLSNDDEVDIYGIEWVPNTDSYYTDTQPAQLNGNRYTVANVTTDTFELSGVDGSAFNAYVSGGAAYLVIDQIRGLWHAIGETVQVLGNGEVQEDLTVSATGTVTFTSSTSRAVIGLRYICDLETLDVEAPRGTVQGKLKKNSKTLVRFKDSYPEGLLYGKRGGKMYPMAFAGSEALTVNELFTGDHEVTMPPGWDTHGRMLLRHHLPTPVTVLAVVPDFIAEADL